MSAILFKEFIKIMAPPFILSVLLITVCCIIFVKPEPLELSDEKIVLNPTRTIIYLVLFALAIAIVFRSIPYWIALVVIPAVLIFADKKALAMVDYGLLFTFVFFFIFAGNLSRISAVDSIISYLLDKDTLLVSVASCQGISNVPSAILLSRFTTNYKELLIGVNIGLTDWQNFLFAFVILILTTVLNYLSPMLSSKLQISATVIKLIPISLCILCTGLKHPPNIPIFIISLYHRKAP